MSELAFLLETAAAAAHQAGILAQEKLLQPRQHTRKGFRDLVTDVDIDSQKLITEMIMARFPTHGFLTEEDNPELPPDGPIIWIIDPIDGTTNYSRQTPLFSVSVAAVAKETGDVLVGVVYDPMRQELFQAAKGLGGWLHKRPLYPTSTLGPQAAQQPLHVSPITQLSEVVAGIDLSHSPQDRQQALALATQLGNQLYTLRIIGTAALAMAWLAAGRIDAYVNHRLKPWDIAAGSLLIQEAGGQVTTFNNQPWQWTLPLSSCLASNGRIHLELRELLPK